MWLRIAETGASRIYSLVSGLAILIITARVLGPEGRGLIVAAGSWIALYGMLSSLSLGQVAQSLVSQKSDDDWLSPTFSNIFLLSMALSGVASLVFLAQYLLLPASFGDLPPTLLFVALMGLPFIVWEQNGSLLLVASENLRKYNFSLILGRSATIILVITSLLLIENQNLAVLAVVGSQVLGQSIIAVIIFHAMWQKARGKFVLELGNLHSLLGGAARQHFSSIGAFLIFQSSILLLNAFSDQASVGIYQLAIQFINVMLIIPTAASLAFYSGIAKVGPDAFWKEQKKMSLIIFVSMCGVAAVSFFLAPFFIPLIAGAEFTESVNVFQKLLPILVGLTASQLMASQWISRGIFTLNSALTGVAAISNIVLGFWLISRYGLNGAIISDLVSIMGVVFFAQIVFALWCNHRVNTTYSLV